MTTTEQIASIQVEHDELKVKLIKQSVFNNTELSSVTGNVHRNLLLKQEMAMQMLLQCLMQRIMVLQTELANA